MTWRIMMVFEKGCILNLAAQFRADFVRLFLAFPFWTLTTILANVSLLSVKLEEVGTIVVLWLVTNFVVVVSVVICGDFFPWKSVAEIMINIRTSKLISWVASFLRNTRYIVFHVVLRALRFQNEGSIVVQVVVFNLIVMSIARGFGYFLWVCAVAERRGKPVVTDKFWK